MGDPEVIQNTKKLIAIIMSVYDDFQCSVIEEHATEWFPLKTGVKQGCYMSGFLFFTAMEWLLRNTVKDKRKEFIWNFTPVLKDQDFADKT